VDDDGSEVEPLYSVPTHLKEGGSVGVIPTRVLFLCIAAAVVGGGPAVIAYTEYDIGLAVLVGFVPLLVLLPFMAWWQDPPPEWGLSQLLLWPFKRKTLGPQHIRSTRSLRIERGVIFTDDGSECRAILALPTVNLEHASIGAKRRHRRQLGALLDGLSTHQVQVVVRGIPLPKFDALDRMRLHRNPIARKVADWLAGHYKQKEAVDRPRYLVVPASDEATLRDRVDSIVRSLRQINMEPEQLTNEDELRDLVNDWWTWRPHPVRFGAEHVRVHADCLELDGEWAQVYALGRTASSIVTNWWARILDGDLAVDATMNLAQQSLWWAKTKLDMKINDLSTSGLTPGRSIALEQARKLRFSLEGGTRPWDAEILFVIRGHDRATMDQRARRFKQQISDLDAQVRLLRWEQLEGFEKAQPLALGTMPYRQIRTETGTIARTTPLAASTMQVAGGVPFGFAGSSPILFTLRRPRRVLHMGWYGVPNAGKGFGLRMLLARRHFSERLRLFLWDNDASHHEYSGRFCEFLGGHAEHFTSLEHVRDFEIDPLWQVVAFDVTQLPEEQVGEAFMLVKQKVEEHCLAFKGPAAFVVDEATDIAEHPDPRGAAALSNAVTHWRKFGIECHVVTQRVSDWMGTHTGRKVQGSLAAKWYGQMEPTELADVASKLGLSQDERDRIESAGIGQGLLVAFGRRVWADLFEHGSPDEYEAYQTDPPESILPMTRSAVA
jgi:hypothetical protein